MTKQTNCNYRTPYKPQVQYYDEQMVIINGVQYQRVEPQKPITLERIIVDCMIEHNSSIQVSLLENILDRVEVEFLRKFDDIQPPLYADGWNGCVEELKGRLRE